MKILVIAIPGLGNTLLAMPMLKEIRSHFPESRIDLLVGLKASEEIMKNCPYINNIFLIDKKIFRNFSKNIETIKKLKKEHYDISITTFPAAQPHYNILAKFIGAKKRITHDYKKNFINLQTDLVPINICHDVEQNLSLLKPLNVKFTKNNKLEIWLNKEEEKFSTNFIRKYKKFEIIGIHPGSSVDRGMKEKRWNIKKFAELADKLTENKKRLHFFIFIGSEEKDLEKIKDIVEDKSKISIIKGIEIRKVAAIINKCKLFISNDSGLMHIAAACNVPTLGIFTQTDYRRTYPYGKHCRAVYKGKPYLRFRQSLEELASASKPLEKEYILEEISSEDVYKIAIKMLK